MTYFRIVGAVGLVLISAGVLMKSRGRRNVMFIAGGIFLEIYSIGIGDVIFMTLQLVFILSAAYDLARSSR